MTFSSNFLNNELFNTTIFHERLLVHEDGGVEAQRAADFEPPPHTPAAGSRSSSASSGHCGRAAGAKRRRGDGAADRSVAFGPVKLQNPYLVHRKVVETIRREFAVEDMFHRSNGAMRMASRVRRRRKPLECVWKPESVYKSYVELKPDFFDKSSYQSHVPRCSCFGKINMRIPKAWTRGPNKKRRKSEASNVGSSTTELPESPEPPRFDDIFSLDFLYK